MTKILNIPFAINSNSNNIQYKVAREMYVRSPMPCTSLERERERGEKCEGNTDYSMFRRKHFPRHVHWAGHCAHEAEFKKRNSSQSRKHPGRAMRVWVGARCVSGNVKGKMTVICVEIKFYAGKSTNEIISPAFYSFPLPYNIFPFRLFYFCQI